MQAVVPTRRKEMRPPTHAAMRHKVLAAGTQRLHVPILRRAAHILPRAAATAAVAHLMPAVGEAPLMAAAAVLTAVVVVLTAIVKISEISIFQEGPSLSNAAGLLLS
jgi:hypothetical protein